MQVIELPYPPSLNHYYRHVGPKVLISAEGRRYQERVGNLLLAHRATPVGGPLALEVELYPPDRRRRDIDNTQKGLLDALQAAVERARMSWFARRPHGAAPHHHG